MKKITLPFLLLLLIVLPSVAQAKTSQQTDSEYEQTNCFFAFEELGPLGDPEAPQYGYECGYVTVPEEHGVDNGRTIRLPVAVKKGLLSSDKEPLFMAQGGPGGDAFSVFGLLMATSTYITDRDLVIFNQRGTKYAEPDLSCTEVFAGTADLLSLPEEEATELSDDLYEQCYSRLEADGVNFSAFDSLENAADIEDIRVALGYDKINFYGVSYGTLLGQHLIRDFPNSLNAVILDSVVPTNLNFLEEIPNVENRVYQEVFSTCEADAQCSADYPDLENRFYALLEKLNDEPTTLTLKHPDTGEKIEANLNGDILRGLYFQSLYAADVYAAMPRAVSEMEAGDFSFIEFIWPIFAFDDSISETMYLTVICAEDADFDAENLSWPGVPSIITEGTADELALMQESCERLDVEQLPDSVDMPVESNVPTLLLSGQFDPITPPSNAAITVETLENGYSIVDPSASHGVAILANSCIEGIVSNFLDDPTVEPSSSCVEDIELREFVGQDIVKLPILGDLLSLSATIYTPMALLGIGLFLLMASFFLWPVTWLVRKIFNRETVRDTVANRRRWIWRGLILLFLIGTFAFIGLLIAAIAPIATNQAMIFLTALPASSRTIFIVPILLLLLVVGLTIWLVRSWADWSILGKIFNVLLLLSAGTIVFIFASWGMLTPLFG